MAKTTTSYEYPTMTRLFYNGLGLPLTVGITGLCAYALLNQTGRFLPDGLSLILGMTVSTVILIGLLFNYWHLGTIIVNDREIRSLKPGGTVAISWKDIAQIYYKIGRGKQLTEDPFFTLYIFSKQKDFIIVNREIDGIRELMDTIRQYAATSKVKYIQFPELVRLFIRFYISRLRPKAKTRHANFLVL